MHINFFVGYSQEQQDNSEMMDLDTGFGSDDIRSIAHIPLPGEEGWDLDCEGGELHVFEGLEEDLARAKGSYVGSPKLVFFLCLTALFVYRRHPDLHPRTWNF